MKYLSMLFALLIVSLAACEQTEKGSTYKVARTEIRPQIDAIWDKKPWTGIEPLQLDHFMGEEPDHFPITQAKIAFDSEAIYVIFKVLDRYVKAVAQKNQGPVWKDSCVEFFFSPENSTEKGYFNLEMNCGGTMLFHHQMEPRTNQNPISDELIQQIDVAHTLPSIVDPEIEGDTTWIVEYRIPFAILGDYHTFTIPQSGTLWRANLYKCADETSHPHWLTWAPVDVPHPDFHRPEFFGVLEFE